MPDLAPNIGAYVSIEKTNLQRLFVALQGFGYTLALLTLIGVLVHGGIRILTSRKGA